MASRWSDLDRPPLSQARLARAVQGGRWESLRVVASTPSTNADVAALLRAGATGVIVIAEEQTAGKGRLGRTWSAPARSSVLMTVGFVPDLPEDAWPLLPLLAGVVTAAALDAATGLHTALKWPNDVLVGERKVAGILAERVDRPGRRPGAVVGVGVNVSVHPSELPVETATSVAIEGGVADREPIVAELARGLQRALGVWERQQGDPAVFLPHYRQICATIGTDVALDLPGDRRQLGCAVDVDDGGRLVVRDEHGAISVWSAGDVTHVRPTSTRAAPRAAP
jgi:BirA family biotin operon repressor/biotin-[acetyl-CoA-carboxylase] ligase